MLNGWSGTQTRMIWLFLEGLGLSTWILVLLLETHVCTYTHRTGWSPTPCLVEEEMSSYICHSSEDSRGVCLNICFDFPVPWNSLYVTHSMSTLGWVVTLSPKSFPLLTKRPWLKVVKLQIRGAVGVGWGYSHAQQNHFLKYHKRNMEKQGEAQSSGEW